MFPDFYIHYLMQDEDLDLLFCHRWLVLCFKREFIEPEVLNLWEACWSRYQTDYFHIFICVAMICLYGSRCVEGKMRIDEMMQYFMDMAMQFDGSAVLKEARSLLYRFRKFQVIPCTLKGFLSGPGVWDGGIEPEIECISRHRRCCIVESLGFESKPDEKASDMNGILQSTEPEKEVLDDESSTKSERPDIENFSGESLENRKVVEKEPDMEGNDAINDKDKDCFEREEEVAD